MDGMTPYPEWRILVDAFGQSAHGTEIGHGDIAALMGISYGSQRYRNQVSKWKRAMLREHDRAVLSVTGVGYRLVEPDRYTSHSRDVFMQGRRRIKKAVRIAAVAPIEQMTQEQAQKHANHLAYLAPVVSAVNAGMVKTRPTNLYKTPDLPKLGAARS